MLNKRGIMKLNSAIFIGYKGTNYHGLQKSLQSDQFNTIENELEKAIYKAKLISDDNFGNLARINWNRVSRTDKGVHAALNCITFKAYYRPEHLIQGLTEEELNLPKSELREKIDKIGVTEMINSHLPDDIKVFGKHYNASNSHRLQFIDQKITFEEAFNKQKICLLLSYKTIL